MSICSDKTLCPNGSCIGCKGGQQYCGDPRCYPNCEGCNTTTSSGNWIIITIILILLGVLLVMSFVIGYDWYNKGQKAAEPKNVTVNKHVHNIKQPPIVVSSSNTVSSPNVSVLPVESFIQPENFLAQSYTPAPVVSYQGIELTNPPCNRGAIQGLE